MKLFRDAGDGVGLFMRLSNGLVMLRTWQPELSTLLIVLSTLRRGLVMFRARQAHLTSGGRLGSHGNKAGVILRLGS